MDIKSLSTQSWNEADKLYNYILILFFETILLLHFEI
jgi:hypothetical protein